MKITDIAFTIVPVTDLARSREFYEHLLGLKPSHVLDANDMGMVEYDVGGKTLALGSGKTIFKPTKDGGAVALEVADFSAAVAELKDAGCQFAVPPRETPESWMAVVSDPDGNYLIIQKRK
jgi:predicted enzyme related to lactoylglutathione lyase